MNSCECGFGFGFGFGSESGSELGLKIFLLFYLFDKRAEELLAYTIKKIYFLFLLYFF